MDFPLKKNTVYLSVRLSVFLSVCLSLCPSVRSSVRLSVCPSVPVTFLAATKQLYEWYLVFPVYPSVCPSVRHTFLTMFLSSYHHEIFRKYHQAPG